MTAKIDLSRWPQFTVFVLLLAVGTGYAQTPGSGSGRPPEQLFRVCKACHTIDKDGEDMLGPNLWNVYGAKAASRADFPYSAALKNSGLVWTEQNLEQWLAGPSKFVPGSKMAYPGMTDPADRAALIAWLKTQAD
jgi:cytochrome c